MKPYWLWNREVILEEGKILPDPIVVEKDNELVYDGDTIRAEINEDDVFDTLIKAGLLKEPKQDVYKGSIHFEDGVSAVGSDWGVGEGRFDAVASRPSFRDSDGLAAFEKTDKMLGLEKVEIAKTEYEALLRDSQKLKELKPRINDLNSILA
jgi:hypothetical protein